MCDKLRYQSAFMTHALQEHKVKKGKRTKPAKIIISKHPEILCVM